MPQQQRTQTQQATDHKWVGAAEVPLDQRQAKHALLRLFIRPPAQERIDILDVYCGRCRRAYDDVNGQPCSALENNEHLRGGPIGTRAARKHPHDCLDPNVQCDKPYRPPATRKPTPEQQRRMNGL